MKFGMKLNLVIIILCETDWSNIMCYNFYESFEQYSGKVLALEVWDTRSKSPTKIS